MNTVIDALPATVVRAIANITRLVFVILLIGAANALAVLHFDSPSFGVVAGTVLASTVWRPVFGVNQRSGRRRPVFG